MPHASAQPRPYALVGAGLLLAAGALLGLGAAGAAALLVLAALMLFAQSVLLHRSATRGLPREEDRLRAALLVGEDERLLDLRTVPRPDDLPAGDAQVDAVLGVLVLSRLEDADARERASREIARVLAPGGRVALLETRATHEVALALEDLGLVGVERSPLRWSVWPPAREITGHRTGAGPAADPPGTAGPAAGA